MTTSPIITPTVQAWMVSGFLRASPQAPALSIGAVVPAFSPQDARDSFVAEVCGMANRRGTKAEPRPLGTPHIVPSQVMVTNQVRRQDWEVGAMEIRWDALERARVDSRNPNRKHAT